MKDRTQFWGVIGVIALLAGFFLWLYHLEHPKITHPNYPHGHTINPDTDRPINTFPIHIKVKAPYGA